MVRIGAITIVLLFVLTPVVGAEISQTMERFLASSRFVREFGFFFTMTLPDSGCSSFDTTEDKYPLAYIYRKGATTDYPSQVAILTRRNPRVIGQQVLALAYPSRPSAQQRKYLAYFIEEATRRTINSSSLIRKIDSFLAAWYQQYVNTGRGEFKTRIGGYPFIVELTGLFDQFSRRFGLQISAPDFFDKVPCPIKTQETKP